MSDDKHWDDNRDTYAAFQDFHADAHRQHEERISALQAQDPIKLWVTYEPGHRRFEKAHALAVEAFPDYGPFHCVQLKADPWKSSGSWLIHAMGRNSIERNIGSEMVARYLG